MKRLFLMTVSCLLGSFLYAQQPDFSGSWILEKDKSKMDEHAAASIQRQTITVTQTTTEIKVSITTEQTGSNGGKRVDIGGQPTIYKFDGSETVATRDSPIGPLRVASKGSLQDNKLKLITSRSFNDGASTAVTEESWELSAEGTILTIQRKSETQRGTILSELVYRKA